MNTQTELRLPVHFSGSDYVPEFDEKRLTGQLLRIFALMRDQQWRTVPEIHDVTTDPHASISAQLRNLRKMEIAGFTVPKRRRGDPKRGVWEYQLGVKK